MNKIWALALALVAVSVIAGAATYYLVSKPAAVTTTTPQPTIQVTKYEGEFKIVGLDRDQLESPFYSDFEINPVVFENDEQKTAGNATLALKNGTTVNAKDFQLDLYIKIRGTAENLNFEYDADDNGNANRDTMKLKEVSWWNYDDATKLKDITVEDDGFDADLGVTTSGEYVLRMVYHAVGLEVPATDGTTDLIGTLDGEIKSDGDQTEFSDFGIYLKADSTVGG